MESVGVEMSYPFNLASSRSFTTAWLAFPFYVMSRYQFGAVMTRFSTTTVPPPISSEPWSVVMPLVVPDRGS